MKRERIEEIKRKLGCVTPWPWTFNHEGTVTSQTEQDVFMGLYCEVAECPEPTDAAFIAQAPELVMELIEAVEKHKADALYWRKRFVELNGEDEV
jgi:hypothetical protein